MDNDIIDISLDFENLDNGGSSWNNSKKTNFGGGIELLMNEKKMENSGPTSDIDIEDLNNLEDEMNNLANEISGSGPSSFGLGSIFGSNDDDIPSVRFDDTPSIGRATTNTESDSKTWDGYGKFNNIPIMK